MIDLHSHVLPQIDDGADSLAESETMLDTWHDLGFTDVAATPHLKESLDPGYRKRVDDARIQLTSIAADRGIRLHRGFEVMLFPELPNRLERGEPLTFDGQSALLVEVPFQQWPLFTETVLFNLQIAGYQPVLAHPERYTAVQQQPSLAISLAERGIILQVTYASLVGALGHDVQRTAEIIVEANAAGILATDAHNRGVRLTSVKDGLQKLTELVGEERVQQLTTDVPHALLHGTPPPAPLPLAPQPHRRRWFGR